MGFKKGHKTWNKGTKGLQISWSKGLARPEIRGKLSPRWGGNKVGYSGIHLWMLKTYGNPPKCEKCGKLGTRKWKWNIEWALLKGKKYQRKRENFWGLCSGCHKKYDMTAKTRKRISLAKLSSIKNKKTN